MLVDAKNETQQVFNTTIKQYEFLLWRHLISEKRLFFNFS